MFGQISAQHRTSLALPMASATDYKTSADASARWFTTTHWSVVLSAGQSTSPRAEAALEELCRAYWYPLYAYVRRQGHSPHDAQDLTQEFFARLLQKNYLGAVARDKGKFRSFLLVALKHFLANEFDRATALKRGGGQTLISLDEQGAEELYALESPTSISPENAFEKRWAITLLERALAQVRSEFIAAGKGGVFEPLKAFLTDGAGSGNYAPVAVELGMTANAVAVAVCRLRQRYREVVRAEIAHTVAAPEEIEDEMRHLFAVLAQ
jgi:RNA polymerase sigma-70 factor (ECF subfamily)